jgi:prophage maintenance system killer protein
MKNSIWTRQRSVPCTPESPATKRLNGKFSRRGSGEVSNPFERATAFFLFGSLQQFFFDGNKRTSRFMMNGVLMSQGIDAVSIPAVRAAEFNSRMVDFYITRDATEMMAFVLDCHPEASRIREHNPGLASVRDLPSIQYVRLGDSMASGIRADSQLERDADPDLDA